MINALCCLLVVACVLENDAAMASQVQPLWVTAEGAAPIINNDEKTAMDLALRLAHQQAIKKTICQGISIESLTVSMRLSGALTGSIPHCKIIESEIVERGPVPVAAKEKNKTSLPMYRYTIKASVIAAETKADPEFTLETRLNRTRYREGEEMVIQIVPSKPCYCYIYTVFEDGRVIQLMPNRFTTHRLISAGQPILFPDQKEMNRGITLKTHLPVGKKTTIENVYIVGLKEPGRLSSESIEEGIFSQYESNTGFFEQLVAMVATIPAHERTEKLLPYQIVNRKP